MLFRTYWILVYLFLVLRRVLMKKKWGSNRRKSYLLWNMSFRGKILVNIWCIWLDFNTELQKCNPSAHVDLLVRIAKNKTLLYLPKLRIRRRLDGPISDCKSVDVLPRAIAQNPRKFEPIPRNSTSRLAERSVVRSKNKNHQKMGIKCLW